jgi:hypothetical protein
VSYRCPACMRRVRSAPYVSLQDRHPCKITCYHGNVAGCLEVVTVELQRRGPGKILLGFYHTRGCGDPAGRMSCRGDSYKVGDSVEA